MQLPAWLQVVQLCTVHLNNVLAMSQDHTPWLAIKKNCAVSIACGHIPPYIEYLKGLPAATVETACQQAELELKTHGLATFWQGDMDDGYTKHAEQYRQHLQPFWDHVLQKKAAGQLTLEHAVDLLAAALLSLYGARRVPGGILAGKQQAKLMEGMYNVIKNELHVGSAMLDLSASYDETGECAPEEDDAVEEVTSQERDLDKVKNRDLLVLHEAPTFVCVPAVVVSKARLMQQLGTSVLFLQYTGEPQLLSVAEVPADVQAAAVAVYKQNAWAQWEGENFWRAVACKRVFLDYEPALKLVRGNVVENDEVGIAEEPQDVLLSKSLRRRVVSLVINGDGNFEGYQFERQGVIEQVIGSSSEQYKAVVVQSKQPCTCHSLPGHVPTADPLVLRYGQSLFDRLGQQFEVAAADWRAYKEITGAIGIMLQAVESPAVPETSMATEAAGSSKAPQQGKTPAAAAAHKGKAAAAARKGKAGAAAHQGKTPAAAAHNSKVPAAAAANKANRDGKQQLAAPSVAETGFKAKDTEPSAGQGSSMAATLAAASRKQPAAAAAAQPGNVEKQLMVAADAAAKMDGVEQLDQDQTIVAEAGCNNKATTGKRHAAAAAAKTAQGSKKPKLAEGAKKGMSLVEKFHNKPLWVKYQTIIAETDYPVAARGDDITTGEVWYWIQGTMDFSARRAPQQRVRMVFNPQTPKLEHLGNWQSIVIKFCEKEVAERLKDYMSVDEFEAEWVKGDIQVELFD